MTIFIVFGCNLLCVLYSILCKFLKMEEVLKEVKKFGKGVRHPYDEFLKEGNITYQSLKPFGICDFDNENFYHEPYSAFPCHIAGCNRSFETVIEFESHYNSCHSLTCNECGKNLPNSHYLDLHILETHDSFFLELAKRKPMYKCFSEECKECFSNSQERRDHCVKIHKFPSDFRYDTARRNPRHKKKCKTINSSKELLDTGEPNEEISELNIVQSRNLKAEDKKNLNFKGFYFGRGQGKKKPVFYNFSKDLIKSLPES